MIPSIRQQQIIKWLSEQRSLTIEELAARLGVSAMTVHRDLDALVREQLVVKVHGGAILAEQHVHPTGQACALCHMSVQERTAFIIQSENGDPVTACCPHCGFLLLHDLSGVVSVLTKDFLYGRTLNAAQSYFLIDSTVHTCCVPSALCFATRKEADCFRKGFEGTVMDYAQVKEYLAERHHSPHEHHV